MSEWVTAVAIEGWPPQHFTARTGSLSIMRGGWFMSVAVRGGTIWQIVFGESERQGAKRYHVNLRRDGNGRIIVLSPSCGELWIENQTKREWNTTIQDISTKHAYGEIIE